MPRGRTESVCRECGFRTPRPLGRCPECQAWGSFEELRVAAPPPAAAPRFNGAAPAILGAAAQPSRLRDIDTADFQRTPVAIPEFNRVLGGGIVQGSLTLIGGDPGVGKSTLLSQVADQIAS